MSNVDATPRGTAAAQERGRKTGRPVHANWPRKPQRKVDKPLSRPRFARLQQRGVLDGAGCCAQHIEVRCPVCMYSSPVDPENQEEPRCAESATRANAVRLQLIGVSGHVGLRSDAQQGATAPPTDRVAEVMRRETLCVRPEVDVDALIEVFLQRGITSAPVVDGDCKPIGCVSMTDLVRDRHENCAAETVEEPLPRWLAGERGLRVTAARRTVGDVMSAPAICVTAYTSVARAAAVMAFEGIRQLVVSSLDGRAIGVISAVDVLRWVAETHGFAVFAAPSPEQTTRSSG